MTNSEFEKIINIHRSKLFNFVLKSSNYNYDLTEDVVQNTVLKAYKYYKYNPDKINSIKSWLFQIAYHNMVDYYRKNDKELTKTIYYDVDFDVFENKHLVNYEHAEQIFEQKIYSEEINNALEQMKLAKPSWYNVFKSYLDNNDMSVISSEQNIPIGTVKSRIHRARKLLEKYLLENNVA